MEIEEFLEQDIIVFLDERVDTPQSRLHPTLQPLIPVAQHDFESEFFMALDRKDISEAKQILSELKHEFDECPTSSPEKMHLKSLLLDLYEKFKDYLDAQNTFSSIEQKLDGKSTPRKSLLSDEPIPTADMQAIKITNTSLNVKPEDTITTTTNTQIIPTKTPTEPDLNPAQESTPSPTEIKPIIEEIKPITAPILTATTIETTATAVTPIPSSEQIIPPEKPQNNIKQQQSLALLAAVDDVQKFIDKDDLQNAIKSYHSLKKLALQEPTVPESIATKIIRMHTAIQEKISAQKKLSDSQSTSFLISTKPSIVTAVPIDISSNILPILPPEPPQKVLSKKSSADTSAGMIDFDIVIQLEQEKLKLDQLIKKNDIANAMRKYRTIKLLVQQIKNEKRLALYKQKLLQIYSILHELETSTLKDDTKLLKVLP